MRQLERDKQRASYVTATNMNVTAICFQHQRLDLDQPERYALGLLLSSPNKL
jgi:hypothetical protein